MYRVIVILVIFLISSTDTFTQDHLPVKHAMIIAISDYPASSGFRRIDADNDLKIIMKLLKYQGFTDTIVLNNRQASKKDFINSFEKLRSGVKPGDIVYIHFSTHGQQLEDLDGDETDRLDETIALYDSKAKRTEDYQGQNHLTDDEFGVMIEQLRHDLGNKGDILVMIDACHSGSMSRDADTAILRGGYSPIMLSANESNKRTRGENPSATISGNQDNVTEPEKGGMFSFLLHQSKPEDLANYVILSACENNEVSSEYYYNNNYFGPLTWAFLNALLNNKNEAYTYKKLFHDIQYEMISMFDNYKTKQNPTVESAEENGLDKIIFGGKNIIQKPFYTINSITEPDQIVISGGNFSGIFDSTSILVYPSGTTDPRAAGIPISNGVVIQSGYMESVVRIDSPLKSREPGDYWAFAGERTMKVNPVKLILGTFTNAELKKQAISELKKCNYVMITFNDPAYTLEQKKNTTNKMNLLRSRSGKPYKENISASALGAVLLNLAQVQFLKNIQSSVPGIDMEITLLPYDTIRNKKTKFTDIKTMRSTVRERIDTAILCITNTGDKSFFFNIIDIDPDDNIQVILPNIYKPASECLLQPGQRFSALNTFNKPYGTETLKIIASIKKFDLRPVITSTEHTRGTLGDFEKLFGSAYSMRGSPSFAESTEFSTFTFIFDVIK